MKKNATNRPGLPFGIIAGKPSLFDFEPKRGPRPESGYMGIQNHSDTDVVFFKEVSVKPLKKAVK